MKPVLLIRTEASDSVNVGTGHLWRQIYLAKALRKKGAAIRFVVSGTPDAKQWVQREGFACETLAQNGNAAGAWQMLLMRTRPDMVIFDRWQNDTREVRAARQARIKTLMLDGVAPAAAWADTRINALRKCSRADYAGPDYVLMPRLPQRTRRYPEIARTLVISFGGHDHGRWMPKALKMLATENLFEKVWCFCDPVLRGDKVLAAQAKKCGKKVRLFFCDPRLPRYLAKADMGLLSGGLTLFAALALGLPCLALGQYPHQVERCRDFGLEGLVLDLGPPGRLRWADVMTTLREMQRDASLRRRLGQRGRLKVDGKGFKRVEKILWDMLKAKKNPTTPSPHDPIPHPSLPPRGGKKGVLFRPWDTEFFQVRVAECHPAKVSAQVLRAILREARSKDIRCLYVFSPSEISWDWDGAQASFVELRCIYERDNRHCEEASHATLAAGSGRRSNLKRSYGIASLRVNALETRNDNCQNGAPEAVDLVRSEDLPALRQIAHEFVLPSRFYKDGHFSEELCRVYYERYVEKEFRENPRRFWVIRQGGGQPAGFVTTQQESATVGRMVLMAVDASHRGRGLGKTLVARAFQWAREEGLVTLQLSTQQENRASCALYEKTGFRLAAQEWIYHVWL